MIAKLWEQYQQNIQDAKVLKTKNEILKIRIEEEVAVAFQIKQAIISRWYNCAESPIDFCFTNPNAPDPWVCIYCETNLAMPR